MNYYLTAKEKERLLKKKEKLEQEKEKLRGEIGGIKIKSDDSNSDYIYERRELQRVVDEIFRISEILEKAELVEISHCKKVDIGACVVLDFGDEELVYIVGVNDPDYNLLSIEAPLGKSILNKEVGDKVSYQAIGKKIEVEIKDIK
jgi:transcription elongation GreA/GreB family factor